MVKASARKSKKPRKKTTAKSVEAMVKPAITRAIRGAQNQKFTPFQSYLLAPPATPNTNFNAFILNVTQNIAVGTTDKQRVGNQVRVEKVNFYFIADMGAQYHDFRAILFSPHDAKAFNNVVGGPNTANLVPWTSSTTGYNIQPWGDYTTYHALAAPCDLKMQESLEVLVNSDIRTPLRRSDDRQVVVIRDKVFHQTLKPIAGEVYNGTTNIAYQLPTKQSFRMTVDFTKGGKAGRKCTWGLEDSVTPKDGHLYLFVIAPPTGAFDTLPTLEVHGDVTFVDV